MQTEKYVITKIEYEWNSKKLGLESELRPEKLAFIKENYKQ